MWTRCCFSSVHSVANCKAPKISLWINDRETQWFYLDLIYYAFAGVQSQFELVNENRYRSPDVEKKQVIVKSYRSNTAREATNRYKEIGRSDLACRSNMSNL